MAIDTRQVADYLARKGAMPGDFDVVAIASGIPATDDWDPDDLRRIAARHVHNPHAYWVIAALEVASVVPDYERAAYDLDAIGAELAEIGQFTYSQFWRIARRHYAGPSLLEAVMLAAQAHGRLADQPSAVRNGTTLCIAEVVADPEAWRQMIHPGEAATVNTLLFARDRAGRRRSDAADDPTEIAVWDAVTDVLTASVQGLERAATAEDPWQDDDI